MAQGPVQERQRDVGPLPVLFFTILDAYIFRKSIFDAWIRLWNSEPPGGSEQIRRDLRTVMLWGNGVRDGSNGCSPHFPKYFVRAATGQKQIRLCLWVLRPTLFAILCLHCLGFHAMKSTPAAQCRHSFPATFVSLPRAVRCRAERMADSEMALRAPSSSAERSEAAR